ncbi:uncharacterized protein LOC144902987 isoform X2 [Branchiostoma floridae x Branchiostoma belcheri]
MASAKGPGPPTPNFADCCRFCGSNLRLNGDGGLKCLRKIFDAPKKTGEKSIDKRLASVGVVLQRRKDASERLCLKCFRSIGHVENALILLQKWKDASGSQACPIETPPKNDKPQSPTKTQIPPVSPTKTPPRTEKRVRETPTKTPPRTEKRVRETPTKTPPRTEKRVRETPTKTPPRTEKRVRETPTKTPPRTEKRVRETPTKTPRAVKRLQTNSMPLKATPLRISQTKVTVTYPSRPERPDNIRCTEEVSGIVEKLARGEMKAAARLIFTCESLVEEVKKQALNLLEHECNNLTTKNNNFILRNTNIQDMQNFSFNTLQSDLQRLSPFFLSVLNTVSRNSRNHTCASAAVALRGRDDHLSAFAHYVNTLLQYGGAKKAVFTRLCKLGISTTQENGRLKQKELATTCGKELQALKEKIEAHAVENMETQGVEKEKGVETQGVENMETQGVEKEKGVETQGVENMETQGVEKGVETQGVENMETQGVEKGVETQGVENMETQGVEKGVETQGVETEKGIETQGVENMETQGVEKEKDNYLSPTSTEMCNLLQDFSDLAVDFLDPPIEPESQQSTPPPPPTYSIVYDNLDFYKQTHHQSETNANQDIHWTNHIAVQDRVSTHHLPDNTPIKPLPLFQIGDCLPTPEIQALIRHDFIIIGSRFLTRHVPALQQLSPAVIHHIPHEYTETMSQPSTEFLLGLLFKNESITSDLVDILQHMQQEYVPRTAAGLQPIFIGGDRLTEGNSRCVQWAFAEGEIPEDRLEGLLCKFEDWHAIRNLFEIHYKVFYSDKSARDHGTLLANMNKIKCSNAKKGPHGAFNAYKQMVTKETSSMFITCALPVFGMNNVEDTPKDLPQILEKSREEQRTWLHTKVAEVVDKFVFNSDSSNLTNLYTGVRQSSQPRQRVEHNCREPGCQRKFVYLKSRLNHEMKEHGLDFGETDHKEVPTTKPPNPPRDYKKEHTEARLSFGLFLEDMQDAVREGDGERLLRLYTVALLYYRAYGHTQYAYSTLLLLVQITSLLSPANAHSLKWNRFFNGKGGKGKNISLDLHLEHLNNFLKSFLKGMGPNLTQQSAHRVSKSLGALRKILEKADKELGVVSPSGYHRSVRDSQDILTLVDVFREAEVFQFYPGRAFAAFPNFERNLFSRIKYDNMWEWIVSKLKLWNKKY